MSEREWMSIDSAPKDGRFVLLHVPEGLESGTVTVGAYWKEEWDPKGSWDGWLGMDGDIGSSWCDPTHWMPLPEPPPHLTPDAGSEISTALGPVTVMTDFAEPV